MLVKAPCFLLLVNTIRIGLYRNNEPSQPYHLGFDYTHLDLVIDVHVQGTWLPIHLVSLSIVSQRQRIVRSGQIRDMPR